MNREDNLVVEEHQPANLLRLAGWGKRKSTWRGLILIVVTMLIFLILFQRIDLSQVWTLLGQIPWFIWLLAVTLTLSFPVMTAIRWKVILQTMGHDISIGRATLIIVGIWPLSSISPSKSGDLLKAYSLRRELDPVVVAGSVLTERLLDVLVLAVLALLGGWSFRDYRITLVALAILMMVLTGFIFSRLDISLPVAQKVQDRIRDLFQSLRLLDRNPKQLLVILLFTLLNWVASIWQAQLLFQGVGANVPIIFAAAALPVAIFVGLIPISFGGMGTRDTALVILFAAYATTAQALTVGLLYSFFGYWLLAVGGLPLMRRALDIEI